MENIFNVAVVNITEDYNEDGNKENFKFLFEA